MKVDSDPEVVVVGCAGPAVRALFWETVEIPQLQLVSWTWSLTCPLCSTTDAGALCFVRALCTGPGLTPAIRTVKGPPKLVARA